MLWLDKHAPKSLDDLSCNPEITEVLRRFATTGDTPHLLFHGPSGAGKKTRMMALLRALFGQSIDKVKAETIQAEGSSTEFISCASTYHNQISAAELGNQDRQCVQQIVKQLAAQMPASVFSGKKDLPKFRVFVILEAESLSNGAQASLRRTLEKYVANARVFLHCQRLSSVISPLRSRCLNIRVPLPSDEEISNVLYDILRKEELKASEQTIENILLSCRGNLRAAIVALESAAISGFPNRPIKVAWQSTCEEMVKKMFASQTPKTLLQLREGTYDLLCGCISGDLILETLTQMLLQRTTNAALKLQISRAAAHYIHNMRIGSKPAWHIEAFNAQAMHFMSMCKSL